MSEADLARMIEGIRRSDDQRANQYTKKFAFIKARREEHEGRIAALEGYVAALQDQVEELLSVKKGKKAK